LLTTVQTDQLPCGFFQSAEAKGAMGGRQVLSSDHGASPEAISTWGGIVFVPYGMVVDSIRNMLKQYLKLAIRDVLRPKT
jgi:hypothetical protein